MQLLLIRHGQSEADLLNVHEGRADFKLTEKGIQQARLMSKWIESQYQPDLILASPLLRAKETAQILSEQVQCKVEWEDDLMEWNNGVLAGLPREEAAKRFPEPAGGHPPHLSVEDGEPAIAFRMRAEGMLSKILHEHASQQRVAIVSHGGFLSQFLQAFLKQPISNEFLYRTEDTGIHLVEVRGQKRIVHFLNSTKHFI